MSTKTQVLKKIELSLSYYLPEDFHIVWPKRLRAESTHPENWPKRPTYQGRNDPPPKLAETTQAETTQAETTQGRNDPDSPRQAEFSRNGHGYYTNSLQKSLKLFTKKEWGQSKRKSSCYFRFCILSSNGASYSP